MDIPHQHLQLQILRSRDTLGQYRNLHDRVENIMVQNGRKKKLHVATPVRFCSRNLRVPFLDAMETLQRISLEVQNPRDNRYTVMEKLALSESSYQTLNSEIDHKLILDYNRGWEDTVVIQLPYSETVYDQILSEHEIMTESPYILGANDCRHHAISLLDLCFPP